jgi:hypothetical protein
MVEERMVREQLVAEGHDPAALGFRLLIADRRQANHAHDDVRNLAHRAQREASWKATARARWLSGEADRDGFTRPQWELILERFAGANTPDGQAIATRALEVLADT